MIPKAQAVIIPFPSAAISASLLSRTTSLAPLTRGSFAGTRHRPLFQSYHSSCILRLYHITPRQHRSNSSHRQRHPVVHKSHIRPTIAYKSQLSSTYLLITVVLAFSGAILAYTTTTGDATSVHEHTERKSVRSDDDMVDLPGRPGNLTPEEEVKLKQFWRMTLKVTGVDLGEVTSLPDTTSTINEDLSSLAGDKKRKSLFGRKSKVESKSAPEDDKYGQTKEYQEALATTSPDEFRRALWRNSKNENPDAILLRFLRARKWDLQKALVMMISTLQWRAKTMKIEEEIVFKGELSSLEDERSNDQAVSKEGSDFLSQMRKGKSYVHGMDREGRPVTWVRVRLHHGGEQSDSSIERFTVHIFETTRLLIDPPSDTGDLFFDMSGFSMANMDYTPVKFMIKCFEANYPESLGVCLIYKAPWIFQGFWKIISRWLDPVVASKIHFTNSIKDLEPWVDRSQVPQEMGGDSPYVYHYIEPHEGENDLMKDVATRKKLEAERAEIGEEFERLTIEWIKGADVNARRQQLAAKMKQQYWKLDPYVRARSLYDRLGVLSPDGKIDWSNAIHPISEKPATSDSGTTNGVAIAGAATGTAVGATALAANEKVAKTAYREPDSDNESLASFKTGIEHWEDAEESVPNGTAVKQSIPNGIATNSSAKFGTAAAVATGAGVVGSVMMNGTSPVHNRTPATPVKSGQISSPTSPTKSIASVYSNAGKLINDSNLKY